MQKPATGLEVPPLETIEEELASYVLSILFTTEKAS
jgi:hypothetical protein